MLANKHVLVLVISFLMLAAVTACRQDNPTPASPTSAIDPTITMSPEARPMVAATFQPAATFTPIPTSTRPATPPATAVSDQTLERVRLMTLADFGEERNPFTGEVVSDTERLARRPLAVKISNAPPRWVRPQSGLSQADLVFEHLTEGTITRFTALVYGNAPAKIGPIRSARLIDVELPAMYDAALVFSGSSIGVSRRLFGSDIRPRILRTLETGYYRSGEDKPYEHTLYAEPEGLWQALEAKGENHGPTITTTMVFDSAAPTCCATDMARLTFESFGTVEWRFDSASGRYLRWVDDEPHIDANNEQQIAASNVIILYAEHGLDTTICELQRGDQCLAYSTTIELSGEGDALILRDGLRILARWRREQRHSPLRFYSSEGEPVPLQIGNSWFQVVPADFDDALQLDP